MSAFKSREGFQTGATLASVLSAGLAFPSAALADFKGGDTLKTVIASNWYYDPYGGGVFDIRNSRLEFIVASPATENAAVLSWKANEGGYNQNWFVQVDTYLELFPVTNEGEGIEMSLSVNPSVEKVPSYISITMNRYHADSGVGAGITVVEPGVIVREQKTTTRSSTLRLHYDRRSRTITPSWNVGKGWVYAAPRNLAAWDMDPSETFRAILLARNSAASLNRAQVASGQAYFQNFKVGRAAPEIVVGKSASAELQDKKGTVLFGAAKSDVGKVTKTFRIRNDGTAVLTGLNLSAFGAQAGDFTLSNLGKRSLAPGDTTTFKIAFGPKASGVRNATVFLTSNDADESSFEIKVSGRGVD